MTAIVCNPLTVRKPRATIPRPTKHGQIDSQQGENAVLLTKHDGETFHNQTVYISGQAFVNCTFTACTLVLRETVYHLDRCSFERCNWHVDWVLLWGSPESLREIKALVAMIEQAQSQLPPQQTGAETAPVN